MEKEIKKVYVDCKERYFTIAQEDDIEKVEEHLDNIDEDLEKLKAECGLTTDEFAEILSYFESKLAPGGAYLVKDKDYVEAVCLNLATAESIAETLAQKQFDNLVRADKALLATWKDVAVLKAAILKLEPRAERALAKLKEAHEKISASLETIDIGDSYGDLKSRYIAQEADILMILGCVNHFTGEKTASPLYDYLPEDEKHVPYSLPVRKRLK